MKKLLLISASIIIVHLGCFSRGKLQQPPASVIQKTSFLNPDSDDWSQQAQQYIEQKNYAFKEVSGKYFVANKKQQIVFDIKEGILHVTPLQKCSGFTSSSLSLTGITKGNCNIIASQPTGRIQKEGQLIYDYNKYSIEYLNDASGLRQNFIIKEKPAGDDVLQLKLIIAGDLKATLSKQNILAFHDAAHTKPLLQYDGLAVWDANHKMLRAHMELNNNELLIIANDKDAVYPVTVDPLTHSPEWEASAVGLLPTLLTNLQLQTDALFAYKTYSLGDINGDTYDDVAISAPGAIDIIGASTLVNVGAVFIYFGSPTGLHTSPDRVLRPTTPVANAMFGFSVAAGNVTGTSARDVIIGAPGESYTATVSGSPASATITAGKVYVYDGDDVSNNIVNAPSSLFLKGSVYFTNGILGIGNNTSVNALFGFSVAATDDLDGDGLGEILVGAPGYASVSLVNVRAGAAFIYSSKNGDISSNNETRLNAPSLLNFPGGLLNLDGLLFGYSVDGAGDYNKDGKNDVVVGAPGGLNLSLSSFLGGSAYVYFGNGSTINKNISTQLTDANTNNGLLGSVANLFGFTVKGLTNASGARNGNIIVSAPVANVLNNVAGGLRLKSGELNVFIAKNAPAANESPTQHFSSPRGTSLLSILGGQVIDANVLTGAAIDNAQDANCDGYPDLIVGEPLSTAVGVVNANAVGGAAYLFAGRADGTFNPAPIWTLENNGSFDFGVNAGSLLGFTVSGIGHVYGPSSPARIMVGAPGGALDYSTGILNIGNTLGTTINFAAGNNGLGKSYTYALSSCSILAIGISTFTATEKNCTAVLNWKTSADQDLAYTIIEQSNDGIHFTASQSVNKSNDGSYSIELNQKDQTAYYRLRLMQAGGSAVLSETKKVTVRCAADQLQAFPTLFSSDVKVMYTASENKGDAMLTVTDVYGRKIISRRITVSAGNNQTEINGASLAPGMYYVQVTGEHFKSETLKIIRN